MGKITENQKALPPPGSGSRARKIHLCPGNRQNREPDALYFTTPMAGAQPEGEALRRIFCACMRGRMPCQFTDSSFLSFTTSPSRMPSLTKGNIRQQNHSSSFWNAQAMLAPCSDRAMPGRSKAGTRHSLWPIRPAAKGDGYYSPLSLTLVCFGHCSYELLSRN